MNILFADDERFLDRRGCGDEFYMDSSFKASWLLTNLDERDALEDGSDDDTADD